MLATRYRRDLSTEHFRDPEPQRTVGRLSFATIEQRGVHLPLAHRRHRQ